MRPRIEYIDGLRAIAVLAVLIHHVAKHSTVVGELPYRVLMEGAHGVDLFFVLSGFCLAYPTLAKFRSAGRAGFSITEFGAKRIVRIVPPFYLATIALLILAVVPSIVRHRPWPGLPSPLELGQSLLFLDGHVSLVNGSFWTLMVEFRWYFAFPLLLWLWIRSPRAFCALGVVCIVLYHFTRARGLDLGTMPGFMLGIIAADMDIGARVGGNIVWFAQRFAIPLAVLCAIAGIAVEMSAWIPGAEFADYHWAYQPTILGWQLATFFFVVAAGSLGWLRGLLSAAPLVATGVASYAIYLMHEPIVDVAFGKFHGPGSVAAAFAGALMVGFSFWALAERPFTTGRLRKPLLDRITPMLAQACDFFRLPRAIELTSAEPVELAPVQYVPESMAVRGEAPRTAASSSPLRGTS